jgi:hypothetical protein
MAQGYSIELDGNFPTTRFSASAKKTPRAECPWRFCFRVTLRRKQRAVTEP